MSSPGNILSQLKSRNPSTKFDRWWILVIIVVLLTIALIFLKPDPYQRIILFIKNGMWTTIKVPYYPFYSSWCSACCCPGQVVKNKNCKRDCHGLCGSNPRDPDPGAVIFWYFVFPSLVQEIGTSLASSPFRITTPIRW